MHFRAATQDWLLTFFAWSCGMQSYWYIPITWISHIAYTNENSHIIEWKLMNSGKQMFLLSRICFLTLSDLKMTSNSTPDHLVCMFKGLQCYTKDNSPEQQSILKCFILHFNEQNTCGCTLWFECIELFCVTLLSYPCLECSMINLSDKLNKYEKTSLIKYKYPSASFWWTYIGICIYYTLPGNIFPNPSPLPLPPPWCQSTLFIEDYIYLTK